jgi:hypothetical protein
MDPRRKIAARLERNSMAPVGSSCRLWVRGVDHGGYGKMKVGGRTLPAHRVAWELKNGKIPEGLVIDHLCRVRSCVNPDHMRVTTHKVNVLAGETIAAANARKTHCPQGHPFDRVRPTGRACSICQRIGQEKFKAERAAEALAAA